MDHSVPLTGGVAISHGRNQLSSDRGGLAAAPIRILASDYPVERSVALIVALIVALTVAAAAPGADFELGVIAGPATRTGV
jgi:hypothetical protein